MIPANGSRPLTNPLNRRAARLAQLDQTAAQLAALGRLPDDVPDDEWKSILNFIYNSLMQEMEKNR